MYMNVALNEEKEIISTEDESLLRIRAHKEKRILILFPTLIVFILGLTGTCLGCGFKLMNKEPSKEITVVKDYYSGCYDQDGKLLATGADNYTYDFIENANCYTISQINVPSKTETIVLNELYQGDLDINRYLVKGIGYSNGENAILTGDLTSLKTIITNTAYLSIGAYSLSNLSTLENLKFGNTNKDYNLYVHQHAFENDTNLKTVHLGNALKEIDNQAFLNCVSLEAIQLSKKISKLGSEIFKGCDNLNTIIYPNTKTKWEMIEKDDSWLGLNHSVTIKCVDATINLD